MAGANRVRTVLTKIPFTTKSFYSTRIRSMPYHWAPLDTFIHCARRANASAAVAVAATAAAFGCAVCRWRIAFSWLNNKRRVVRRCVRCSWVDCERVRQATTNYATRRKLRGLVFGFQRGKYAQSVEQKLAMNTCFCALSEHLSKLWGQLQLVRIQQFQECSENDFIPFGDSQTLYHIRCAEGLRCNPNQITLEVKRK